jgi:hypothetical protein
MPESVFEVVLADSRWWFRSPSRESSFSSKTEAIEAALRSSYASSGVRLRVYNADGSLEGELALSPEKLPAVPTTPGFKTRKEVDRATARSIQYYSSRPIEILNKRIEELDQEIPLEAFVYRGGAALTILSLTLLLLRRKNWGPWIMALSVAALQLQYSYQGRNPITDRLRRRGYRSRKEIEAEKYSLEAIRGDFAALTEVSDPIEKARKCLDIFL